MVNKQIKIPKWWYESKLANIGHPIIDHIVVKKREDGLIQVHSRPYRFSMVLLWKVMIQCKAHGINFTIDGFSDYNNETLTIIFYKFKDLKDIEELLLAEEILKANSNRRYK